MGYFVLLIFIIVPIIEISVFILVGEEIGLWPTIACVILTAIIGTSLLRRQGLSVLARAQNSLNEGRLPAEELFDGLCLLLAGAFLLTPGFVTDGFGFLLFFPPFRATIKKSLMNVIGHRIHVQSGHPKNNPTAHRHTDDSIIDADFEEVDPNPNTPWGNPTEENRIEDKKNKD